MYLTRRINMSQEHDDDTPSAVEAILTLVFIFIGIVLFVMFARWFADGWHSFFEPRAYYCQSLKKIVEVEPLFEDNGKYEDESYKVKYEDGSTGLVDNATQESGYYCVSQDWIKHSEAPSGWVLKP
jgi:hypothetical protein